MVLPVTGPAADNGKYSLTGAKIALDRVNKAGGALGKQVETRHRGRSDDQSGRGARLLQARRAARHRRLHRLDPLDAEPRHGARHPEDGKARLLRRHRSQADEDGQSLADPLPAERYLLRPRDRLLRRGDAGQEELGDRPFHRCVRRRAASTPFRPRSTSSAPRSFSTRAIPTRARISRPSCSRSKSSGADVIGSYFTFDNDIAIFARQLRQLGVTLPWVGSPSIVVAGAVKLAGPALWGTYGIADYAVDSSPEAKEFARALRRGLESVAGHLQLLDL